MRFWFFKHPSVPLDLVLAEITLAGCIVAVVAIPRGFNHGYVAGAFSMLTLLLLATRRAVQTDTYRQIDQEWEDLRLFEPERQRRFIDKAINEQSIHQREKQRQQRPLSIEAGMARQQKTTWSMLRFVSYSWLSVTCLALIIILVVVMVA